MHLHCIERFTPVGVKRITLINTFFNGINGEKLASPQSLFRTLFSTVRLCFVLTLQWMQ